MEGDLTKPQPGHGSRRRPRAGAAARVGEPLQNIHHLPHLCRGTAGHTAKGSREPGCVFISACTSCWSCPWPGSRVSHTSLTSSKASTPFPEVLTAMGYCQIAKSCQTRLQTPLAPGSKAMEHRQRASGNVPPRVLGRYRHREGHLISILRPSTALLEPTAVLGTPAVFPPQLGLRGAGAGLGIQEAEGLCPAEGLPVPLLKSTSPAPQESR